MSLWNDQPDPCLLYNGSSRGSVQGPFLKSGLRHEDLVTSSCVLMHQTIDIKYETIGLDELF